MSEAYRCRVNLLKLTILSYSLTFICGVMVILPFILKVQAAHYFHSSLEKTGFIFSFFMIGMVIAQYTNGFLVKLISLKCEIFFIALLYCLSIASILLIHNIDFLVIPLVLIGFCAGLSVTLPNFIIVHAFRGYHRSSRLNRLDLFFSVGSFIYPMLTAIMIAHFFSWITVYASVIVIFVLIITLALVTKMPNINQSIHPHHHEYSKWNINVYLVALAIFCFFLSYVGFTYWLEPYLQINLGIPVKTANFSLTLFWVFYAIGCFISSVAVKYIKLHHYIIASLVIAIIAYIGIDNTHDTHTLLVLISILGLGCATAYSSGISFGTHQVAHPSPRIVALYVTFSGIGTLLGESYSSLIETHLGFNALALCSTAMMVVALLLFAIVASHNRIKHSYHDSI